MTLYKIKKRITGNIISEKGAVGVFLTIAFTVMMLLAACLFAAGAQVAGKSCTDAALRGAGRSILSEYDKKLMSDYGLLAFHNDEDGIAKDLAFYANAGMKDGGVTYVLFRPGRSPARFSGRHINPRYINVNLKEFSLLDLDRFEEQVREAALGEFVKGRLKKADPGNPGTASEHKDRVLRNKGIIGSLPSNGVGSGGLSLKFLKDIANLPTTSELADRSVTKVLVDEYILDVFGNAYDGKYDEERFYQSEVEYIIAGDFDEARNKRMTQRRIFWMREALNNLAIISDPEKMKKIEELAELGAVAGELGVAAVAVLITEAWVAAESKNDIKLLKAGEKVALYKTPANWALNDIEAIWNGTFSGETVKPSMPNGLEYSGYLRIMLFLMDRTVKLLRMMDLIQINMKGTYDEKFLIREHYTGYRFKLKVYGDEFEYTETY